MTCYALYLNTANENIEVYPIMETHNLTKKEIEQFLENAPEIEKWILYDHMPTNEDIECFEEFIYETTDNE